MAKAEPVIVTIELSEASKAILADLQRSATEGKVVIERRRLAGWDNGKVLSGADWRAFIEALPAGEFATALLSVADAIDEADGTGWFAREGVSA